MDEASKGGRGQTDLHELHSVQRATVFSKELVGIKPQELFLRLKKILLKFTSSAHVP